MHTIAVNDLRSKLMKILKDIEHGTSLIITSKGKEIAKLVPPDSVRIKARDKLNKLGKTAILKDIISPIDEQWKVMK